MQHDRNKFGKHYIWSRCIGDENAVREKEWGWKWLQWGFDHIGAGDLSYDAVMMRLGHLCMWQIDLSNCIQVNTHLQESADCECQPIHMQNLSYFLESSDVLWYCFWSRICIKIMHSFVHWKVFMQTNCPCHRRTKIS